MNTSETAPHGVRYLDQVEQIIGLRFFSHEEQEQLARTDLTQLPENDLQQRAPLYIAGLGLLAEARRRFNLPRDIPPRLSNEQALEIRNAYQPQIESIRQGILALADDKPPADVLSVDGFKQEHEIGRSILKRTVDKLGVIAVPYRNHYRRANTYYRPNDIERIVTYVNTTLPVADATDVRIAHIRETYRMEAPFFDGIVEELDIPIAKKRSDTKGRRWAHFISSSDAQRLERRLENMNATTNWVSVKTIAEQAGVSLNVVRKHITHDDYSEYLQKFRVPGTDDDLPSYSYHLPRSLAEDIIARFQIIVPDEYLTIGEFAALYDYDHRRVERVVNKMRLPTHRYPVSGGEQTIAFLDGATMSTLRHNLRPFEQAPNGWVDMKTFKQLAQVSDTGIGKYLATTEWSDMDRMQPPKGVGGMPRPFYPPEAVAYVRSKVRPPEVEPEGWINVTSEANAQGIATPVVAKRLSTLGYTTPLKIRQGTVVRNFYPPEVMHDSRVEAIIGPPPLGWEPLPDVAAELGLNAVDTRLLLASKGIPAQVHKLTKASVRVLYCPSPTLLMGYGVSYSSPDWPGGVEPVVYDAPELPEIIPTEYLTPSEFAYLSGMPLSLIQRHLKNNPDILPLTLSNPDQKEPFLDGATMHAMRTALRAPKGFVSLKSLSEIAGITHTAVTNRLVGTPWQSPEPTMPPDGVGWPIGHYPPEAIAYVLRHGRAPKRARSADDHRSPNTVPHTAVPPIPAPNPAPPRQPFVRAKKFAFNEPIVQDAPAPTTVVPDEYLTPRDFAKLESMPLSFVQKYLDRHPELLVHEFGEAKKNNIFLDGATVYALRKALIAPAGAVSLDALADAAGVSNTTAAKYLKGTPWEKPGHTLPPHRDKRDGYARHHYPVQAVEYVKASLAGEMPSLDPSEWRGYEEPIVKNAPPAELVVPYEYQTLTEFSSLHGVSRQRIRTQLAHHPEIPVRRVGEIRYNTEFLDGAGVHALRSIFQPREDPYDKIDPPLQEAPPAEPIVPDGYLTPSEFARLEGIPRKAVKKHLERNPQLSVHEFAAGRYSQFLDGSTMYAIRKALIAPVGALSIEAFAASVGVRPVTVLRHLKGTKWEHPGQTLPADRDKRKSFPKAHYPIEAADYIKAKRAKIPPPSNWHGYEEPVVQSAPLAELVVPDEYLTPNELAKALGVSGTKMNTYLADHPTHTFDAARKLNNTFLDGAGIHAIRAAVTKDRLKAALPPKPRYEEPIVRTGPTPPVIVPTEFMTPSDFATLNKVPQADVKAYLADHPAISTHEFSQTKRNNVFLDGAAVHALRMALKGEKTKSAPKPTPQPTPTPVATPMPDTSQAITGRIFRGAPPKGWIPLQTVAASLGVSTEEARALADAQGTPVHPWQLKKDAEPILYCLVATHPKKTEPKAEKPQKRKRTPKPAATPKPSIAAETKKTETSAATPERPIWRPGKLEREAPFALESPLHTTNPLISPATGSAPFTSVGSFQRTVHRQAGESTMGLPNENKHLPATHRTEEPGSWTPAVETVTPSMYISNTLDKLTAAQIAERLGISQDTVVNAIGQVDAGGTPIATHPSGEPIYTGSVLLAIREQLVGIPFEYVSKTLGFSEQTQQRAIAYLRRRGYRVFGDPDNLRISPGTFKFLSDNAAAAAGVND